MQILRQFFSQTKKPEGFLGALMLRGMNSGHAELADWALSLMPGIAPQSAVDLGCGGGRNIAALQKKYPHATVDGFDYSALSVEKAIKYNASAIAQNKCTIAVGDVSNLKPQKTYDLATAFETIYFWPGLEKCFTNVFNMLNNNAYFLIVCESDGKDKTGKQFEKWIDGMKVHSPEEIENALHTAGFEKVKINHHDRHPWIAVCAQRG